MEKELRPSHILYGLIGINKNDKIFPKDCKIDIECDGISYKCSIPKAGKYICGLGECHRLHKAIIGTKINIDKAKGNGNTYTLRYETETKGNNSVQRAIFLLENYPWMFCKNETNVRCEIIEPILRSAGWEFPDLRREVYMGKGKGRADYILYQGDDPKVIIEAKSHNNVLNQNDIKAQLLKYWKDSYKIASPKDVLAIATNGQEWQLWRYNSDAVRSANADLIKSLKGFMLFVKLLTAIRNNTSTVDAIVHNLEKNYAYVDYSSKRHSAFEITNISGNSVTDRFQQFIKLHQDKVLPLAKSGCFDRSIIAETKDDAMEQFGTRPYDKIDNLYITADYDTYTKRMIVLQIINKLHLAPEYIINDTEK